MLPRFAYLAAAILTVFALDAGAQTCTPFTPDDKALYDATVIAQVRGTAADPDFAAALGRTLVVLRKMRLTGGWPDYPAFRPDDVAFTDAVIASAMTGLATSQQPSPQVSSIAMLVDKNAQRAIAMRRQFMPTICE